MATIVVLDGLDLGAEPGQVHVVLGPNGAGRTTTVKELSHAPGALLGAATRIVTDRTAT